MKRPFKLSVIGIGVAALAAAATPALAANPPPVNVSLTSASGGTRTLNLLEPDGSTPLAATDLSSGTSDFVAQVVDNGYSNTGFTVQATMSNLYHYVNGAYVCGDSPIPSSAVTLSSPSSLLSLAGVNANLTPVFTLTGSLTPLNTVGLLSTQNLTGTLLNGQLPAAQTPLTQSQITGSTLTNLVGPLFSSVGGTLPISLPTTGLGGGFTTPDAHPTCDASATGAQPVDIMSGTADPTGLLSNLQSLITSTVGQGASPTLLQLKNAGYLNDTQITNLLDGITGIFNVLGAGGIASDLLSIEGTLTATISSVTGLAGSLVQSGTYSSSPSLTVNTSKIPATGTYKGFMTVSLISS